MTPSRTVIVGGGMAGLAAAYHLLKASPRADVLVLEAEPRFGGNVRTLRRDGCVVDLGPDALLTRPNAALDLCEQVGIHDELAPPSASGRPVLVPHEGALRPLPEGLLQGLPRNLRQLGAARFLSFGGKARAALDLILPSGIGHDDSVGGIVERRLGREVKDRLVEPIIGGIYAGDVDRLDARVVMPSLAVAGGSVLRRLASAPRPAGSPFRGPRGGMVSLVAALARALGPQRLRAAADARQVERHGRAFLVRLADGSAIPADRLILATPPHRAAPLVARLSAPLEGQLLQFSASSTVTVVLAFDAGEARLPDASGMLIPRTERAWVRAVTFVGQKWPGRVRRGLAVLRASAGRGRADAHPDQRASDVVERVLRELRAYLPLPDPIWSWVQRYPLATPQPEVGHALRVADARARAAALGPLYLAGAAYDGPGIAATVLGASRLVRALSHD